MLSGMVLAEVIQKIADSRSNYKYMIHVEHIFSIHAAEIANRKWIGMSKNSQWMTHIQS